MKKLKRRLCLLLAVVMIVPAIGCGKEKDKDKNNNVSPMENIPSAEEMKEYVYKEEELNFLEDKEYSDIVVSAGYIYAISQIYEMQSEDILLRDNVAVSELADNEEQVVEAPADNEEQAVETSVDNEEQAVEVPVDNEEQAVETDEKIEFTADCYDMSGNKLGSYKRDYPMNSSSWLYRVDDKGNLYYIYEEYDYNEETGFYKDDYYLKAINSRGEENFTVDIGHGSDDAYFFVNSIFLDEDGIKIVSNSSIIYLDYNGELIKEVNSGGENYANIGMMIQLEDGRTLALGYGETSITFYWLDMETGKFSEPVEMPSMLENANIFKGDTHDLIASLEDGLYYYDIGEKKPVKFLDFMASDMYASGFNNLSIDDNKVMYGTYYDENNCKVVKLTKVDPKDVKAKETITLGGLWIDSTVRKKAVEFNKNSSDVRISFVDYSQIDMSGETTYDDMINAFNTDIVSGNVPDIVLINSGMNYKSYVSKGIFEDLYPYLDKDKQISKDDLLPNVLEAFSVDGKLCGIAPRFYIQTLYAKAADLNGKTSWNMSEFMQFVEDHPECEYAFGMMSKEDFINVMMWANQTEFIDWSTGKVSYDSDEFIKVLKYTDNLPKEINYESEEVEEYWNSYDTLYREGRALLYSSGIAYPRDILYIEQGTFGEKIVPIGYPSATGKGSAIFTDSLVVISSKSSNKEAAWEFVKTLIKPEEENMDGYGLSIVKATFDKQFESAMEDPYYMNGNKKEYYKDTYYVGGEEIKIKPMTQKQVEELKSFVCSVNAVGMTDDAVSQIVLEEAHSYFDGSKSAEDVAKVIQSRVQIYVNENR